MGKRRVIEKTTEEIIKESEKREETEKKASQTVKSKKGKIVRLDRARIYIQSTYNNTLITITDSLGGVVAWSSAGTIGFRGPKKSTPFAASKVVETLMGKVRNFNIKEVEVFVKGMGSGRDAAVRAFANNGLEITSIKDVTPIPHNGCRRRGPRRV